MNYYELVGVASTASSAEIEKKIKDEYRKNQRRVNNADQAKRQAAEQRASQLMDAKRILLDPVERRAHDLRLAATPAVSPVTVGGTDWLAEAQQRLDLGDFQGALHCTTEAQRVHGDGIARMWSLMAQANSGLGNASRALFEAQRAVALAPGEPEHHFVLGVAHSEMEQWDAAIRQFETVRQLDPSAEHASLEIAYNLQRSGREAAALQLLEQLHTTSQDQEYTGDSLGFALITAAENVPACRFDDGYSVTSPQEIVRMRQHLMRAWEVASDPELREQISGVEAYLRSSERKHLPPGAWIRSGSMVRLSVGLAGVLGLCLCGSSIAGESAVASAMALSVIVVLGYAAILGLIYAVSLKPQWQSNLEVWRYETSQRNHGRW